MVSPHFAPFCLRLYYLFIRSEFAEYTSAQERIALGKKSRKKEASQRRVAMEEMIADAYVVSLFSLRCMHIHILFREEEDEETMEWEHEQLRRGGHRTPEPSSSSSKVKQVYKAAPSKQPLLMTSRTSH